MNYGHKPVRRSARTTYINPKASSATYNLTQLSTGSPFALKKCYCDVHVQKRVFVSPFSNYSTLRTPCSVQMHRHELISRLKAQQLSRIPWLNGRCCRLMGQVYAKLDCMGILRQKHKRQVQLDAVLSSAPVLPCVRPTGIPSLFTFS
jgi:hypothetical protein